MAPRSLGENLRRGGGIVTKKEVRLYDEKAQEEGIKKHGSVKEKANKIGGENEMSSAAKTDQKPRKKPLGDA